MTIFRTLATPPIPRRIINRSDIGQQITDGGILLAPRFQYAAGTPEFMVFAADNDITLSELRQNRLIDDYNRHLPRAFAHAIRSAKSSAIWQNHNLGNFKGVYLTLEETIIEVAKTAPSSNEIGYYRLALWHTPPLSLVAGYYPNDPKFYNPDNMFEHRNMGRFAATFAPSRGMHSNTLPDSSNYYVTSSALRQGDYNINAPDRPSYIPRTQAVMNEKNPRYVVDFDTQEPNKSIVVAHRPDDAYYHSRVRAVRAIPCVS